MTEHLTVLFVEFQKNPSTGFVNETFNSLFLNSQLELNDYDVLKLSKLLRLMVLNFLLTIITFLIVESEKFHPDNNLVNEILEKVISRLEYLGKQTIFQIFTFIGEELKGEEPISD